jgi:hypothetical protein
MIQVHNMPLERTWNINVEIELKLSFGIELRAVAQRMDSSQIHNMTHNH